MEDATPFAPNAEFHDAQVDVLYRNMPAGILASAVNASLLAALLWPLVPHPLLFLWCLTLWIIAGARALLIVGYRRGRPAAWTSADWHRWMLIGTTAAGVGWGSSAFFLSPAVPLSYELIQVLVLGGMTAGAASVLSVSFRLFLCYAIATTFPILGHFFLSGEEFHTLMGLMGTLFVLATTRSAWNYNRTILSSIRLRLDKAALVESLTMRTQASNNLTGRSPRRWRNGGSSRNNSERFSETLSDGLKNARRRSPEPISACRRKWRSIAERNGLDSPANNGSTT